jgi:dTMP kinase
VIGTLVAFEGVDGSGKSTLLAAVAHLLEQRASISEVLTTFEPGDTALGAVLRAEALQAAADPMTELLLFAADRADHTRRVLRPALLRGAVVLCDRFEASSIAYQGEWRGLGASRVRDISAHATGGLHAHLTVWVDVPEPVARQRRARPLNAMDAVAADAYRQLSASFAAQAAADPQRWLHLDGTLPVEQLARTVADRIEREHHERQTQGRLLVVCGPSGSGKNTLVAALQQRGDVTYVLSATTRPAREGECDGVDYRFVDDDAFDALIAGGELVEWSCYAGHRYGTPAAALAGARSAGRVPVLVLDLAGLQRLRSRVPGVFGVFLTEQVGVLAGRLAGRGETTPSRRVRLARAAVELAEGPGCCEVTLSSSDPLLVERLVALVSAL